MQTYQGNKRVMATYYDLPFDPRSLNLALPSKLQGTIEEPLPALNTLARSQGQPLHWGASMGIYPNCPENLSFNCPQPTHQPMFMNDFQAKPNVYQIECSSKGYLEESPEIYEQQKEASKSLNLKENKISILSNEKKGFISRKSFRLPDKQFSSLMAISPTRSRKSFYKKIKSKRDEKTYIEIKEVINPNTGRRNRLFTCSYQGCSKEFYKKWNCTEHYKTHTKEKPFACYICGMFFAQKGSLFKHIKAKVKRGHDHGYKNFIEKYHGKRIEDIIED